MGLMLQGTGTISSHLIFQNTGWIIDNFDQLFVAEQPENAPDGANHRVKACLTLSELSLG
jgi:hypothetical protein